jgi:hypothetical protein
MRRYTEILSWIVIATGATFIIVTLQSRDWLSLLLLVTAFVAAARVSLKLANAVIEMLLALRAELRGSTRVVAELTKRWEALAVRADMPTSVLNRLIGLSRERQTSPGSIVAVMLLRQSSGVTVSYVLLAITAAIAGIMLIRGQYSHYFVVVGTVSSIALLSLFLNRSALAYRIQSGSYGTSEYELRQLLRFIINHSDSSDFTDSNGQPKPNGFNLVWRSSAQCRRG